MTSAARIQDFDDPCAPEALYQMLAEHATDLLSLNDADGRQLWASRSLVRLRGRVASLVEDVHPDDREAYDRWWQQVLAGRAEQLRWRIRSAAGKQHFLETSAAVLRYRDHAYVLCTARDITQQQEADDALRAGDLMLRVAARQAQLAYWEDDLVADRVSWSEGGCVILGDSTGPNAMIWTEWLAFIHPEDRALVAEHRAHILRGGESVGAVTFRLQRHDGTLRYVETHVEIGRDDDGRPVRAFGAMQDVTSREQSAIASRANDARLRLALEGTGLGTWEWNLDLNTAEYSDEWKRQLGYAPHDIADRYDEWESRLHPDDRARVLSALRDYLDGRRPEYELEMRLRHKDGSYRWIHTRGVVLRDGSATQTRMVGGHVDVTEQKRREEHLRQAQKMEAVGRLAAGIAHDFNNLLTIIDGYADILAQTLDQTDPSQADLGEIKMAARSAASLTRQLLEFSRQQIVQPQILDLNGVLRRLEPMLGRVIGEDVTLTIRRNAGGLVNIDPGQLEQVVMNLAVNARDAMPDGGRLTIETRDVDLDDSDVVQFPGATPGMHVLLEVSDTGSGMDAATRAQVFEPFYTTKAEGKGTGLGLATVYEIVKQNQGSIVVSSEQGHGATFSILLPTATGSADAPLPVVDASALRGTETVLVVEDQPDLRGLLERTLRRRGYTVLPAASGDEAVAIAKTYAGTIDLLLTDVILPGANGRETALQVLIERPAALVIYMSGYTDDAIIRHGVFEKEVVFLQKPFTGDALARRIREVLSAESQDVEDPLVTPAKLDEAHGGAGQSAF